MATAQQVRERKAQIRVEGFNADYGVGTAVRYRSVLKDDANIRETRTRSAAFVAASGDAVIFLEGISGFVALDHCEFVSPLGPEPVL